MEKTKFVLFLSLSFVILIGYNLLTHILWPPQPEDLAAARREAHQAAHQNDPPPGEVSAVNGATDRTTTSPAKSSALQQNALTAVAVPPAADVEESQKWFSLGSLDINDGYRLLVQLTNRGAVVERVELASLDYTDLTNRSGYLGFLAPLDLPAGAGCRVRMVSLGTPAHEAALLPGDILKGIELADTDMLTIHNSNSLQKILSQSKPGQDVRLLIERHGQPIHLGPVPLRKTPLAVMRPEREQLLERNVKPPVDFRNKPSYQMTLQALGQLRLDSEELELAGVNLLDSNWQVKQSSDELVFRKVLPALELVVTKTYSLSRIPAEFVSDKFYPGYGLNLVVEIQNVSANATKVAYRLDGPTGLPIEGWWYANKIGRSWGGSGLRDVVVRFGKGNPQLYSAATIADEDVEPMGQGSSLMYAGVDAQYFASVLIPEKQQLGDVWFSETQAIPIGPNLGPEANKRLADITCRLISQSKKLDAGQSLQHRFQLFAGPKVPDLLANYHQPQDKQFGLKDLVYYGWFWWVAEPLLSILHLFYAIVGNYGIAIIMLTVLVRGCMFPLSLKQTRNMQKMQELQPEIKRIAEKHKGDVEKRTRAQQELFRKHNYNPLSGCLPLLVQMPIFLGLYRSLMVDVELRQAPLLGSSIRWCSNLAAPDMLFNWTSFMPAFITQSQGIFGLGPYFNILPVITVVLFLCQQKMFMPPPTDEQAALQQKMMKYMMLFMGVLFFKVASGLCLYFIASTLWGMGERKLLPKSVPVPQTNQEKSRPRSELSNINGNGRTERKDKKRQKQKSKRK